MRWSTEQVLALAPDSASVAAGRKLAASTLWSGLGATEQPAAVWGACRGGGKDPYRTVVDLSGPAFWCSCPSRKFPCKHALGLLLLWSAGSFPAAAEPADWVASWLGSRAERAAKAQARGETQTERETERAADGAPAGLADPVAARRRAEQREQRMAIGLAELDQWLCDQVRTGLAGTERTGYQVFDGLAARMVDAQVPGVAATARRLAGVAASGEGWPARLLEEYSLLHLLAVAGRSPGAAHPGVRSQLGLTTGKEEVLSGPAVRDRWSVLGLRDTAEDRLTSRRVWLRGERTGRFALVLSFAVAVAGQPLDASLVPGTALEADLHFYPAAIGLRALVGTRYGEVQQAGAVPGTGIGAALQQWATALAADPWTRSWPVVLEGVVPLVDSDGWWVVGDRHTLPLLDQGDTGWVLLAVSGGRPVDLLAEVVPGGLRAISVLPSTTGELVTL